MRMRCPACLGRDIDVVLLPIDGRLACPKCTWEGHAREVELAYEFHRSRFRRSRQRIDVEQFFAL